jgi:hypothetical protein
MIESGKHALQAVLAVFAVQRTPEWFSTATPSRAGDRARRASAAPACRSAGFLFPGRAAGGHPELLAQTGTTGRQFAQLLIRSHQEMSQNDFPELERAAENVGGRRFPLDVEDLMELSRRHGLEVRWQATDILFEPGDGVM